MKKIIIGVLVLCFIGLGFFFIKQGDFNLFTSVINMNAKTATLKTNFGDIEIELYRNKIPNLTNNFIELASQDKYNGTIFHRVIDGFMIQGGDYENFDGTGGKSHTGKYLEDEFDKDLSNVRGTISYANKGKNTNGSQFFINQADNVFLDNKHSVFGKVTKGMEIVDKIAKVKTDSNDAPLERVVIKEVTLR